MIFLLLFLIFPTIEKEKPLIIKELNYLWVEDYEKALKIEKQIQNKVKENPLIYVLKTIRNFEIIMDFSEPDSEKVFLESIDKGVSLCDKVIQEGRSLDIRREAEFLKGTLLAYYAMFYAIKEDYLKAVLKGLRAYNILKKFKEYPDSYLALGIYDYGVSILQKYVGKIFIKGDRRKKGIEELNYALLNGFFVRPLAFDALIEVYLREKKYTKAIELSKKFIKLYGRTRRTLFTLGNTYRRSGLWNKALKVYNELLEIVDKQNSNFNKGIVRVFIAECYYVLGIKKNEAKRILEEGENFIKQSRWYRKDKNFEFIKKLKKQKFFQ